MRTKVSGVLPLCASRYELRVHPFVAAVSTHPHTHSHTHPHTHPYTMSLTLITEAVKAVALFVVRRVSLKSTNWC